VRISVLRPLCLVHLGRPLLIAYVETVVGVISLLNNYKLSKGKPPLGWLNPWLYSEGLVSLNDIMYGSNPGCNTDGFPTVLDGILCVLSDLSLCFRH